MDSESIGDLGTQVGRPSGSRLHTIDQSVSNVSLERKGSRSSRVPSKPFPRSSQGTYPRGRGVRGFGGRKSFRRSSPTLEKAGKFRIGGGSPSSPQLRTPSEPKLGKRLVAKSRRRENSSLKSFGNTLAEPFQPKKGDISTLTMNSVELTRSSEKLSRGIMEPFRIIHPDGIKPFLYPDFDELQIPYNAKKYPYGKIVYGMENDLLGWIHLQQGHYLPFCLNGQIVIEMVDREEAKKERREKMKSKAKRTKLVHAGLQDTDSNFSLKGKNRGNRRRPLHIEVKGQTDPHDNIIGRYSISKSDITRNDVNLMDLPSHARTGGNSVKFSRAILARDTMESHQDDTFDHKTAQISSRAIERLRRYGRYASAGVLLLSVVNAGIIAVFYTWSNIDGENLLEVITETENWRDSDPTTWFGFSVRKSGGMELAFAIIAATIGFWILLQGIWMCVRVLWFGVSSIDFESIPRFFIIDDERSLREGCCTSRRACSAHWKTRLGRWFKFWKSHFGVFGTLYNESSLILAILIVFAHIHYASIDAANGQHPALIAIRTVLSGLYLIILPISMTLPGVKRRVRSAVSVSVISEWILAILLPGLQLLRIRLEWVGPNTSISEWESSFNNLKHTDNLQAFAFVRSCLQSMKVTTPLRFVLATFTLLSLALRTSHAIEMIMRRLVTIHRTNPVTSSIALQNRSSQARISHRSRRLLSIPHDYVAKLPTYKALITALMGVAVIVLSIVSIVASTNKCNSNAFGVMEHCSTIGVKLDTLTPGECPCVHFDLDCSQDNFQFLDTDWQELTQGSILQTIRIVNCVFLNTIDTKIFTDLPRLSWVHIRDTTALSFSPSSFSVDSSSLAYLEAPGNNLTFLPSALKELEMLVFVGAERNKITGQGENIRFNQDNFGALTLSLNPELSTLENYEFTSHLEVLLLEFTNLTSSTSLTQSMYVPKHVYMHLVFSILGVNA
ncbi:hypothetical protein AAMO2058_000313100 [Amorphochlora amoebiformis]